MSHARRPPGRPRRADLQIPTDVAIMTAATALFMDIGYRAVTMEMVADAAGVTKVSVYYHFKDKATLFVATAHALFARARSATEMLLAKDEPLRIRLRQIAVIVLSLPQPFTSFDAAMHEATADLSPEQIAGVRSEERGANAVIERAMRKAAEAGEICAPDPVLIAHAFLALLRVGQTRGEDGNPQFPDAERTAEALIKALWEGIGPRR